MNLRQSHTLLIGPVVLTLLSACSPPSETSKSSRDANSSQTAQMPKAAADAASAHSPGDLDCPIALAQQAGRTLDMSPDQIDSMGRQLGAGGESEIAAAVAGLRSRHPNASEGEIVNYLITAYCPTINARPGTSFGEKQQALRSFATQARNLVGPA